MKKILFSSLLTILIVITTACGEKALNTDQTGKTLVTFDGGEITSGDVDDFKKYRQDNISDNQALEMIIERELLYKEAQSQGITVSLKEAQDEADKAKNMLEQNGTEQDKKLINDIISKLNINESEYWNNYYPKQLIKLMTVSKMTEAIKDQIHTDIIENHSNWGQSEIEKGSKEAYDKVIYDLKSKYKVKYINP